MSDNHRPSETLLFFFPCPLCRKPLDVRMSKKAKPYVTCNECSLQLFIRGRAGVERFDGIAHTHDGRSKAEVLPKPVAEAKLPRGRPRKNPAVAERVERLAPLGPLNVLTGGRL